MDTLIAFIRMVVQAIVTLLAELGFIDDEQASSLLS